MDAEHDDVSIPQDIVFDVLSRLPAKSLCQFRSVCKPWRALISDPTFTSAQRSRTGPHLVSVCWRDCRRPAEVRVMDMDGNIVRVLDVQMQGKNDGNGVLGVLQQQATTPINFIVYREQPIGATAMIIDPAAGRACTVHTYTLESHMLRLGRATPSGTLKVLRIALAGEQICTVATIMDSSTEPLRRSQRSTPPFVVSWYPQRSSTVNGIVYFLPPPLDEEYDATSLGLHRIAAFNLESEEWKMIHGPAVVMQEDIQESTLVEHKGTLGFVQSLYECNDAEYYYAIIWILIDYNKSVWVKEHTIQIPKTWALTKQLGALDDGRILFLVSQWATKDDDFHHRVVLVFYNPGTKTFKELMDKATMGFSDIVMYPGSLLT